MTRILERERHPRWSFGSGAQLGYALLVALLAGVTFFPLAFALRPLRGTEPFPGTPGALLASGIILAYSWLFIHVMVRRIGRLSWAELGWRTDRLIPDLQLGLIAHLTTQAVFFAIWHARGLSFADYFDQMSSFSLGRRIQCMLIGIQAAFLEESMLRGYLQRGLSERLHPVLAVVLTAAFFALGHFRFHWMHLVPTFIYGLVWGALALWTKRLVAGAFAHWLNWTVNAGL